MVFPQGKLNKLFPSVETNLMGSFPRASLLRVEPTGSSFRYKNNFSENN